MQESDQSTFSISPETFLNYPVARCSPVLCSAVQWGVTIVESWEEQVTSILLPHLLTDGKFVVLPA